MQRTPTRWSCLSTILPTQPHTCPWKKTLMMVSETFPLELNSMVSRQRGFHAWCVAVTYLPFLLSVLCRRYGLSRVTSSSSNTASQVGSQLGCYPAERVGGVVAPRLPLSATCTLDHSNFAILILLLHPAPCASHTTQRTTQRSS